MKALSCILAALMLTACSKTEVTTSGALGTPVADYFIANQQAFIDANCGALLPSQCERLYWNEFAKALGQTYDTINKKETEAGVFCTMHPTDCFYDERYLERLFQGAI